MKEILTEYATELLAWLESAAAFTQEQVPLFVEELLAWGLWKNAALALIYAIIAPILTIMAVKLLKKGFEIILNDPGRYFNDDEAPYIVFGFLSAFGGIVLSIAALVHVIKVIKVLVAPRLYLIETVTEYLGGS